MTGAPPSAAPFVVAVGVLIVDVHLRSVDVLPPLERAHLLDDARLTAAGTAAATAVDLARLGCRVAVAGAVGDDVAGDLLLMLLDRAGVRTDGVRRLTGAQTSLSVLPVADDGVRRIWHLRGANQMFGVDHVDLEMVRSADAVHVGGPDALTGLAPDGITAMLDVARAGGALTSMDLLSAIPSMPFEWMQEWAPRLDLLCVNEHQAIVLTGAETGVGAARTLHGWGVDWSAVTLGSAGCVVVTADGAARADAVAVPVVDTTGCGDAFSAAMILARLHGRAAADAAGFANAAAALVATGLGSDAGLVDAEQVEEFAALARVHAG